MSEVLSGMNRLRALFYKENGTTSNRSSWGQGGAADAGYARRYAAAINKGLTPEEARKAGMGNPFGDGVRISGAPNDQELLRWANNSSSPDVRRVLMGMRGRGKSQGKKTKSGPVYSENVLDKLLSETQKAYDEYVNATEDRYKDIKGRLEGREKAAVEELRNLKGRVTEKLSGYGDAQRQKLEQDFAESLANQTANLRASGLDSISNAYKERNTFDLALAKGLLGDRLVDREIAQDVGLTNSIVDAQARLSGDTASFMERRNDIPPDNMQIAQLAMQYGRGNGGQGFYNTSGASGAPTAYMPPAVYGAAPAFVQSPYQMPQMYSMPGVVANRRPSPPRGPSQRPQMRANAIGATTAAMMPVPGAGIGGALMGSALEAARQAQLEQARRQGAM